MIPVYYKDVWLTVRLDDEFLKLKAFHNGKTWIDKTTGFILTEAYKIVYWTYIEDT